MFYSCFARLSPLLLSWMMVSKNRNLKIQNMLLSFVRECDAQVVVGPFLLESLSVARILAFPISLWDSGHIVAAGQYLLLEKPPQIQLDLI